MTEIPDSELLSVREAARACGRNPETIRRWIWSGKLPAEKLGNQLFVRRSAFESYCRETATKPYQAGGRSGLIGRMRDLRERVRARTGNLDVDIEGALRTREEESMTAQTESEDAIERAIRFQEKLRARGYPEVDPAALVKKSREGRMREIRQSMR